MLPRRSRAGRAGRRCVALGCRPRPARRRRTGKSRPNPGHVVAVVIDRRHPGHVRLAEPNRPAADAAVGVGSEVEAARPRQHRGIRLGRMAEASEHLGSHAGRAAARPWNPAARRFDPVAHLLPERDKKRPPHGRDLNVVHRVGAGHGVLDGADSSPVSPSHSSWRSPARLRGAVTEGVVDAVGAQVGTLRRGSPQTARGGDFDLQLGTDVAIGYLKPRRRHRVALPAGDADSSGVHPEPSVALTASPPQARVMEGREYAVPGLALRRE